MPPTPRELWVFKRSFVLSITWLYLNIKALTHTGEDWKIVLLLSKVGTLSKYSLVRDKHVFFFICEHHTICPNGSMASSIGAHFLDEVSVKGTIIEKRVVGGTRLFEYHHQAQLKPFHTTFRLRIVVFNIESLYHSQILSIN